MIVPRPYQSEAVEAVYEHLRTKDNNPCVVLPTGTGKSLVLAQIAKDTVEKWNGRVLILAHVKELLEQNADKIRKLCPELKIGIYSAGLRSRDTTEQVIVAGIQSVYNKACELDAFDLVIVDECFPAGTLIDTPRGQIPIEDLYVGQPVRHALGVGNIEAISSRPAFEIMKLELSNGKSIECTPNHPFFTESGWCKASALAVGTCLFSREDVSRLRERFSSEYLVRSERETGQMPNGNGLEAQKILFPRVPVNGTPSAAGKQGSGKSVHELETESKNSRENVPVLRQGISSSLLPSATDVGIGMEFATVLFNILLQESRESNVSAGSCGKNVRDAESNRSPTIDSRREWEDVEFSTGTAGADSERGNGIPNLNNSATASCGSIALLQTGCGNSISPSGNTTGWREPFCKENTQNRQTDSGMAGGIRVVGITHIKLKSPRTVYNLQVAGHPSFYADGVLVHNCHLIAPEGDGMYRTFLADMKVINPHVRVIGLTATPFRLKGGLICKPENTLNEICYEAGLKEMIQQGYLSPLISRAGRAEANLANLHIRGGEFISDEVAAAMDNDALVTSACREIVELTRDRKSVLIFTASVDHCKHVAEKIQAFSGKECAIVTGDTSPAERAEIIARFKGEFIPADLFGTPKPPLKFLANVNVLTTGFDAPNTDCVVMLRPTNSPGLLIQCAGRGTRLSPETGKSSCLFLDYGGNILRHGPLDMIKVKEPGSGKGGDAPAKKCPQCLALIHAGYTACPECGYVFPPKENNDKMTQTASSAGVISGQVDYTDYEVLDVYYCVHEKRGADPDAPKTMRVDYQVGFNEFKSEWVCPEHTGYARGKFEKWWHERAALGCPMPRSAREAVSLANEGLLAAPESITVKTIAGERFERVTGFRLKERPVMREPGEDLDPNETWTSPTPPDDLDDDIPF
nr:MAG TPA: Chromatin remodeling complex ATPase [Caudoviricetes sp.]